MLDSLPDAQPQLFAPIQSCPGRFFWPLAVAQFSASQGRSQFLPWFERAAPLTHRGHAREAAVSLSQPGPAQARDGADERPSPRPASSRASWRPCVKTHAGRSESPEHCYCGCPVAAKSFPLPQLQNLSWTPAGMQSWGHPREGRPPHPVTNPTAATSPLIVSASDQKSKMQAKTAATQGPAGAKKTQSWRSRGSYLRSFLLLRNSFFVCAISTSWGIGW